MVEMPKNSRNIILTLMKSLKTYIDDPTVLLEPYRANLSDLETKRKDITRARVGFYEQSESVTDAVDAFYANLSTMTYGLDISVRRAYVNDDASRGELPLLDLKDKIIDWANGLDVGGITANRAYTFAYIGSNAIIRNDIFVTMTLNFSAIKDLSTTQN
jgi:hypothetical protein